MLILASMHRHSYTTKQYLPLGRGDQSDEFLASIKHLHRSIGFTLKTITVLWLIIINRFVSGTKGKKYVLLKNRAIEIYRERYVEIERPALRPKKVSNQMNLAMTS